MHCSRRMTHSLSAFFFFYIADLIYIGRELKLLHKSDGWNAGWVKRFDHKRRGRLTFFTKKKIATFYGLPGIQTNLFLFVVHKDLYSYRYKCIINFLQCVCVWLYFFFFYFLYMNFNYCGNLTRWLVFERCSLMHLGWQEDGQF